MSDRPFLKEAIKLFDLLDEMYTKEGKIDMIEIALHRSSDAGFYKGLPLDRDEYLESFDQEKEDEATQKWLNEGDN